MSDKNKKQKDYNLRAFKNGYYQRVITGTKKQCLAYLKEIVSINGYQVSRSRLSFELITNYGLVNNWKLELTNS
jgi:hypothetical protein